jgi:N,N'-diacetyllegionaminate synthase
LKEVKISSKIIGENHPCFVIAEIGGMFSNFKEAKRLIDSALESNVDAIKFQTYEAETMTTKDNLFDLDVTGKISQFEFFKKNELSFELQKKVIEYANQKGIIIFSAPSHMKDLETLEKLNIPCYKVGSDLACHIPLLKKLGKIGKPIILSTGMCNLEEVEKSVKAILSTGNDQIILLHCVSDYPAKISETNLLTINTMKNKFKLPVGYSDHTKGILMTTVASAMGASVIEKHIFHPENSPHVDDLHSANPTELQNLVNNIRNIEKAKGNGIKIPTKSELKNLTNNRVSIIASENIPSGSEITKGMLDIKRPGTGLTPLVYEELIGKIAKNNILKNQPIKWNMIIDA